MRRVPSAQGVRTASATPGRPYIRMQVIAWTVRSHACPLACPTSRSGDVPAHATPRTATLPRPGALAASASESSSCSTFRKGFLVLLCGCICACCAMLGRLSAAAPWTAAARRGGLRAGLASLTSAGAPVHGGDTLFAGDQIMPEADARSGLAVSRIIFLRHGEVSWERTDFRSCKRQSRQHPPPATLSFTERRECG